MRGDFFGTSSDFPVELPKKLRCRFLVSGRCFLGLLKQPQVDLLSIHYDVGSEFPQFTYVADSFESGGVVLPHARISTLFKSSRNP